MTLFQYHGNLAELMQDINIRKNSVEVPNFVSTDLIDTYRISRILDEYLINYFQKINELYKITEIEDSIDKILSQFKQEVLKQLLGEKEQFRQIIKTKK